MFYLEVWLISHTNRRGWPGPAARQSPRPGELSVSQIYLFAADYGSACRRKPADPQHPAAPYTELVPNRFLRFQRLTVRVAAKSPLRDQQKAKLYAAPELTVMPRSERCDWGQLELGAKRLRRACLPMRQHVSPQLAKLMKSLKPGERKADFSRRCWPALPSSSVS